MSRRKQYRVLMRILTTGGEWAEPGETVSDADLRVPAATAELMGAVIAEAPKQKPKTAAQKTAVKKSTTKEAANGTG